MPLFGVPLLAILGLSRAMMASLSGGFLLTAEVLGISAVAIVGKSGYAFIKQKVSGLFKQYGPPDKVSPLRYRIGLFMFFTPLLFGWVSIYAAKFIPGFTQHPIYYALGGDLLLLSSLWVLGGDFWDKIRALFVHDAKAGLNK